MLQGRSWHLLRADLWQLSRLRSSGSLQGPRPKASWEWASRVLRCRGECRRISDSSNRLRRYAQRPHSMDERGREGS